MARLSEHLKYYVRKRISEDAEWRGVKVILSGHEVSIGGNNRTDTQVPGEGEHKIMDFIRRTKAQPGYNPNTRHCLYGLDADLVMLGLISHDPHFSLLREEVTFGRKAKKTTSLANSNMFLLHLSLLREYLDMEFQSVAASISFEYNLERIIDDWILMGFFVGNDFLPHLPGLHINEGALESIWKIYKEILPEAGGYLNDQGTISLPRLQLLLDKLSEYEKQRFEEEYMDANWFKGSREKEIAALEKAKKKGKLIITKDQAKMLKQIQAFVTKHQSRPSPKDRLEIVNTLPERDRQFVQELADALHLRCTWDEEDSYGQPLIVLGFNVEPAEEKQDKSKAGEDEGKASEDEGKTEQADGNDEEGSESEWESEEDLESQAAIQRVFNKYDKAKVVDNDLEDFETSYEDKLNEKLIETKKKYYKEKLDINWENKEELHPIVYRYIEGLQWILYYYYKGVPAWGWFYDYHYAPMISDLKDIASFKFDFDIGKPFLPFQQLMGVLPADSQDHVPVAYRDLMYEDASPIIDFYPKAFDLDMNGKKQDWEAVVKIPFINEERLLRTMAQREQRLTSEEKSRNRVDTPATQFTHDDQTLSNYPSSLPGFFPDLVACQCKVEPFVMPVVGEDGVELITGLIDGVRIGADLLAGFPSMNTLPHQGTLGYHHVNVFQSDSKNQSMVVTMRVKPDKETTAEIAKRLLGQKTFYSWPYLNEGIIAAVSDDSFKYHLQNQGRKLNVISKPHDGFGAVKWRKEADKIEHHYSKRYGVITGGVDVVLHIRPLKGLKHLDTGAFVKDYDGADKEVLQARQMAVDKVAVEDERYIEKPAPPIGEEFPKGTKVIFLGNIAYGVAAQVIDTTENALNIEIAFFPNEQRENVQFTNVVLQRPSSHYYPSPVLARRLGISALALSRVTSTLMVSLSGNQKTNIGLALKFESKGLKVLGYSRKNDRGWEFSEKTYQLLKKYKEAFPEPFRNLDHRGGDMVTAEELAPSAENPIQVVRDMHKWLKTEGLNDLEPVSLFSEQLEKEAVQQIQHVEDLFRQQKSHETIKRALVKGIPRQAVFKPENSQYRLQGQQFCLGDRVTMAQDRAAGGVPLAMKGVVVGINTRDLDVVWDVPFMGGDTLNGRCSEYRGSTVSFSAILNLTRPQLQVSSSTLPRAVGHQQEFKPQLGPRPVVAPRNYQPAAAATHNPIKIAKNPNRNIVAPVGELKYGAAAKGLKPSEAAMAAQSQQNRLQATLLGSGRGGAHHAQPRQHVAPVKHVKPASPKATQRSLPGNFNHTAFAQEHAEAHPQPPLYSQQPPAQHFQQQLQGGSAPHRGRGGHQARGRGGHAQNGHPHDLPVPQQQAQVGRGGHFNRGGRGGARGAHQGAPRGGAHNGAPRGNMRGGRGGHRGGRGGARGGGQGASHAHGQSSEPQNGVAAAAAVSAPAADSAPNPAPAPAATAPAPATSSE